MKKVQRKRANLLKIDKVENRSLSMLEVLYLQSCVGVAHLNWVMQGYSIGRTDPKTSLSFVKETFLLDRPRDSSTWTRTEAPLHLSAAVTWWVPHLTPYTHPSNSQARLPHWLNPKFPIAISDIKMLQIVSYMNNEITTWAGCFDGESLNKGHPCHLMTSQSKKR